MRRFIAAGFALALSACGGGDDFTIDVDRPAARAYGQLSALDGGQVRQLLGLPAPRRDTPGEGEVRYTIPASGDYDDATVAFRVEPVDDGHSRVHVNLEMPAIKANIGGIEKVLSESRAERLLQRKMAEWASGMKSGDGHAVVLEINEMIGALALAMNPDKISDVMRMVQQPDILAEFLSDYAAWDDPTREFAAPDAPTDDPARAAEKGDDPADETVGSDPTPVASEYGGYSDY